MSTRQTTVSIPHCGLASLTFPEPLTPEAVACLEAALGSLLRTLRSDLRGHAADPGAVEFDSWLAQLR